MMPVIGAGDRRAVLRNHMQITYYLEVMSSWCHWVEPTWDALKRRFEGRVDFQWKIAQMDPEGYPKSHEQCEWFYRRSGLIVRSPVMLNSGWFEVERKGDYRAANWVAEAGRDFGHTGDDLRRALAQAAVIDGRKLGNMGECIAVAVEQFGLDGAALRTAALSAGVRERVDVSTREFSAHQLDQRPAFILMSAIGDKAVFSGIHRVEPLAAAIEAMLADEASYASHAAHFGTLPNT